MQRATEIIKDFLKACKEKVAANLYQAAVKQPSKHRRGAVALSIK